MAEKIEIQAKTSKDILGAFFLAPAPEMGVWSYESLSKLLKENGYRKGQKVIITIKPKN